MVISYKTHMGTKDCSQYIGKALCIRCKRHAIVYGTMPLDVPYYAKYTCGWDDAMAPMLKEAVKVEVEGVEWGFDVKKIEGACQAAEGEGVPNVEKREDASEVSESKDACQNTDMFWMDFLVDNPL